MIGDRTEISYQDAIDLKYCNALFKETLRLFPPVPGTNRLVTDELTINGIQVPANTLYYLSSYVAGRMSKNFHNPLEFKPERFFKDPATDQSS